MGNLLMELDLLIKLIQKKKIIFRFEIWFNCNIPEAEINETKVFYGKEFGCSGIFVKNIKVPVKGGK